MKTQKWPIFILIAYFVINILVILGITKFVMMEKHDETLEFLPFALIVAFVLLIVQIFLFSIKVDMFDKRPVPKRKITVTSILVAMLMAIMTFTAYVVLFAVMFGEGAPRLSPGSENFYIFFLFMLFFGSWFFWAWGFLKLYKNKDENNFMSKLLARVIAGSVMELIIAIPSHIIFRQRDDCCAPIFSYFGIVMGTTVLLLAFGPGIVFLYLKRMADKRPKSSK